MKRGVKGFARDYARTHSSGLQSGAGADKGRGRGAVEQRHGGGGYVATNWQHNETEEMRGRGRGREGEMDGQKRPFKPGERIIGYKILETKSIASPSDSIMFCNQISFYKLLNDKTLKKDWIDLMLRTLNNAFQADLSEYKAQLKAALLEDYSIFLSSTCTLRFNHELESTSDKRINVLMRALEDYLDIFHHLCSLDPTASKILLESVKMVKRLIKAEVADYEHLRGIYNLYTQATAEIEKKEQEEEERIKRENILRKTGRVLTNERPEGNFREMSVHPTEKDLEAVVSLRENIVKGGFESVEDYLDIQFRLLREDFVSTIRQGIRDYRKHSNVLLPKESRFKSGDVKIYENFTVVSPNFGRNGVTYIIRIDKKDRTLERVNWASSKRLMYGSLLCLSMDSFADNILFATITERDGKVMEKDGTFEIQFLPESQVKFDAMPDRNGFFLAVESTAYYEAYAHVLSGIQNINVNSFPFAEYIVSAETTVSNVQYLTVDKSRYRFISKSNHITNSVAVLTQDSDHDDDEDSEDEDGDSDGGTEKWPSAKELGLNPSQYDAFKMALTKEFVVIQGPPGTGKTYVGLKIVETLLYNLYNVPYSEPNQLLTAQQAPAKHAKVHSVANKTERKQHCPPQILQQMLVVCYTNHALDQFLEGMLNFCPAEDIVRVGSRSKNVALEQCNLRNKRGRRSAALHIAYQELKATRERFLVRNNLDSMKKYMELSRTRIILHDTPGLFDDQEPFQRQIEDYVEDLEKKEVIDIRYTMNYWLNCAEGIFGDEEKSHGGDGEDDEADGTKQEEPDEYIDADMDRDLENRMWDVEDDQADFLDQVKPKNKSVVLKREAHSEDENQEDDDGFQAAKMTKWQKMKRDGFIQNQLAKTDIMSESEVQVLRHKIKTRQFSITDDDDFEVFDRWRLYRYFVKKFQNRIVDQMKELQESYNTTLRLADDLRKQEDIEALKRAKVIGMTTTGAARMQGVLQHLGPEVVIVEEAAEVLEAHIITALSAKCQHLILIGDHKQLKPNPTVYDLAQTYHLDLSLFERMVNNGLPVKTLNIQHRMRPEISKFMGHIYDNLDDHESVKKRDPIEGVPTPVFFFNHHELESSDEMTMSHSNEFEAEMVVGLARYLLKQDCYVPQDITVITMYTGQLLVLKKKMPRVEFDGIKITSVDNFQGEENKIIIISLVRSNAAGKLGFVKIENRICVSLSRAQYGMYVFGNFDMLSEGSDLWGKMVEEAKKAKEFGSALTLSCQRHHNPAKIEKPKDFQMKTPAGGCAMTCKKKLSCGHLCMMSCHSRDQEHKTYKCTSQCSKLLSPCNHPCLLMCHMACQRCGKRVTKSLPCGHSREIFCHDMNDDSTPCINICLKKLECGHDCSKRCSEPCTPECKAKVERVCSHCSKVREIQCHIAKQNLLSGKTVKCDTPCEVQLRCGHTCKGTCSSCNTDGHTSCQEKCGKAMNCGHPCWKRCQDHINNKCPDCPYPCQYRCSHGYICKNLCSEPCRFYHHKGQPFCSWGCEHSRCKRKCGERCSHNRCNKRCTKFRKCVKCHKRHQCSGLCGEVCFDTCPTCDLSQQIYHAKRQLGSSAGDLTLESTWILLRDCNHSFPNFYMDNLVAGCQPHTIVRCPVRTCGRPILNTPRYLNRTRPIKPSRAAGVTNPTGPGTHKGGQWQNTGRKKSGRSHDQHQKKGHAWNKKT